MRIVWKGMVSLEGAARMEPRGRAEVEVGRRVAFTRLTQTRLERSYRLASLLLRDAAEAQDAVHDAALRAWIHWDELRDPGRFDAWFDRILVNACRDRMRQRRSVAAMVDTPPDHAGPDPYAALTAREALRRVLATLDDEHRMVIVLRYVEDLATGAIAERIGVREGTVRSRLHYALRQLRAAYDAAERLPGGTG
jgi:RNA polymerase sigma-70 factor, ECF subfamily